jgi:hypothetical protein
MNILNLVHGYVHILLNSHFLISHTTIVLCRQKQTLIKNWDSWEHTNFLFGNVYTFCCLNWVYCDMTPESRNSGSRARRPLMSNDWVNTEFPLQQLANYFPERYTVNENRHPLLGNGVGCHCITGISGIKETWTVEWNPLRRWSIFGPHEFSSVRDSDVQRENSRDSRPVREQDNSERIVRRNSMCEQL